MAKIKPKQNVVPPDWRVLAKEAIGKETLEKGIILRPGNNFPLGVLLDHEGQPLMDTEVTTEYLLEN